MNNQIVPVFTTNIGKVCDARSLHSYLQNGDMFEDWIKARIEKYQFVENQDFEVASPITEYHITLNMAKELAIIENTDRGRVIRSYFISLIQDIELYREINKAIEPYLIVLSRLNKKANRCVV